VAASEVVAAFNEIERFSLQFAYEFLLSPDKPPGHLIQTGVVEIAAQAYSF
jgi:hypothetical protein